MSDAKLVGGSEADRKQLLQLLDDYIEANEHFDWERLAPIWSELPEATFFNLNGHTYNGADHWRRLWAFYLTGDELWNELARELDASTK